MAKIDINMLSKLITEDPDVFLEWVNTVPAFVYEKPEKAIKAYTSILKAIDMWVMKIESVFEGAGGAESTMIQGIPTTIDVGGANEKVLESVYFGWTGFFKQLVPYLLPSVGAANVSDHLREQNADFYFGKINHDRLWIFRLGRLHGFKKEVEALANQAIREAKATLQQAQLNDDTK